MVDASENDTIQRRVAIPYGSRPSKPWNHPSVGATASSIRRSRGFIHTSIPYITLYPIPHHRTSTPKPSAPNNPNSYQQIPNPPIQTRKPTNTTAPIIVPRRLDIIKRK